MKNLFTLVETADLQWRCKKPYSKRFQDIYFSQEDGFAESQHVFIKGNDLRHRWQNLRDLGKPFVIGETGFGSGLNFLTAWYYWLKYAPCQAKLDYFSCEKFPFSKSQLEKLFGIWPELDPLLKELQRQYPPLTPGFHTIFFANSRIKLTLMLGDAADCFWQLTTCGNQENENEIRKTYVDAWFLDGFAPAKNETMWSEKLFNILALLSSHNTSLATFSVAKVVKNNLLKNGFKWEKKKGYAAKREMLTAKFFKTHPTNITPLALGHAEPIQTCKEKKAIVLGAGLAGCFTSFYLAKRGWQVALLDKNSQGSGASANRQAVLYPKFSPFCSPFTRLQLAAFLFAAREYKNILSHFDIGQLKGSLLLSHSAREKQRQESLASWLDSYPELGRRVNKEEAADIAGIPLTTEAIYVNDSGWIDSLGLCRILSKNAKIQFFKKTKADIIRFDNGHWHVAGHKAAVLVVACGIQANNFSQTAHLPLLAVRGQMTKIPANEQTLNVNVPLCANGHVLPAFGESHWIGATYEPGDFREVCHDHDNRENLSRLMQNFPGTNWSTEVLADWAAVRATTADYMPLVGPVVDPDKFQENYNGLAKIAKPLFPKAIPYFPGLYVACGFGSRGLTTIPLVTNYLAGLINEEINNLPYSMIKSINPSRFFLKEVLKNHNNRQGHLEKNQSEKKLAVQYQRV